MNPNFLVSVNFACHNHKESGLLKYIGAYRNILESIGIYWSLLEYIGVYWNILESIGINKIPKEFFSNCSESTTKSLASEWVLYSFTFPSVR